MSPSNKNNANRLSSLAIRALANDRRLQILEWLKDPTRHFPPRKSTVKAEGSAYNDGFGYYSETVQFEDVPGKCKWPVRVGSTCRVTNVDLFFGIAPLWVQVDLGQLSLREKWSWKPGAAAGFAAVFDGKIIRPLELDGP
jgi:hypothetical protein